MLRRGLKVKEMELRKRNCSDQGNFAFGIDEHIDLGLKYDPSTGIYGMNFFVNLVRAGKRVHGRKIKKGPIGKFQRVSAEEAKQWFVEKMGGTVL